MRCVAFRAALLAGTAIHERALMPARPSATRPHAQYPFCSSSRRDVGLANRGARHDFALFICFPPSPVSCPPPLARPPRRLAVRLQVPHSPNIFMGFIYGVAKGPFPIAMARGRSSTSRGHLNFFKASNWLI